MDEDDAIPRWIQWLLSRRSNKISNEWTELVSDKKQHHNDTLILENITDGQDSELQRFSSIFCYLSGNLLTQERKCIQVFTVAISTVIVHRCYFSPWQK